MLAALLLAGLAITMLRLRRGNRFTWPRAAAGVITTLYGVGVCKEVLQPFQVGIDRRYFPGWRAFVHLTPLFGAEPSDLVLNVLLFLPLGVLLPLLGNVQSVRCATLIGLFLSLAIEVTQLILDVTVSVGRVADVNDLLGNTFGTVVGYLALRLGTRAPPLVRPAASMTWPVVRRDTAQALDADGHSVPKT